MHRTHAAAAPRPRFDAATTEKVAVLQHDPDFVLRAVAARMGIALLPETRVPTLLLESRTAPERWRAAAERHWRMRPAAFTAFYMAEQNEIYLIDEAAQYERRGGTLDDALAHELVHYLQARYRRDALDTDWAELEAVQIQHWFRAEYMQAKPRLGRVAPALQAMTP